MTRQCTLRQLPIVLLAVVLPVLAACGAPQTDIPADLEPTPTATVAVTPTATQALPTAQLTATATPGTDPMDTCQEYLDLDVRLGEIAQRAWVSTYQCRNLSIDSTGPSPDPSPGATVAPGAPIQLTLAVERPPREIDLRLYPQAGLSASFMRWPEELPTGIEPVDRLQPDPGLRFQYLPQAAPGEYSLVIRITWEGDVDVFYAINLALGAAPTATEEAIAWATYANPVFRVSLQYPAHWQPTGGPDEARYGAPSDGAPPNGAAGGFFILDAIGAPQATIDDVAAGQAAHKLRPYGSQPAIEALQAAGQEARLILPSADANMGGQAMLIVRYPQPVEIAGTAYQFFALYADEGHVRAIADSLRFDASATPAETYTPAPPSGTAPDDDTPARPQIAAFRATPARAKPGDAIALTWAASGKRATLCPSARYVLFTGDDCRLVDLAGETTFTLPLDTAGNHWISFLLTVEGGDGSAPEVGQATVALECSIPWFFSDEMPAGICPRAPIRSPAAAQRFERGSMIWLEQPGQYYILQKAPVVAGEVRKRVDLLQDPLQVVRDTSAATRPPEGLYAPESGFGLVWRGDVQGSPGYQDALGWALAPEYAYEGLYQCDDAPPSGGYSWQTCHLKGPDGEVYVLHPLGGWILLGERPQ